MTRGKVLLAGPANDPWESCPKKEMPKKEISTMESRNHENVKIIKNPFITDNPK